MWSSAGKPHKSPRNKETAMVLASQQLQQFSEDGYLFLPGCFAAEEVAILRDEAERIFATKRQEVWREKTGAPRTARLGESAGGDTRECGTPHWTSRRSSP